MGDISHVVQIDLEEFLEDLLGHEVQDVIEWLSENNHLQENEYISPVEIIDIDHYNLCSELNSIYYQLSNEELETLKKIRNKYL